MTNTELIKKIIIEAFYYVKAYFTSYLFPIIKEAFEEAKNYFIEILWMKAILILKKTFQYGLKSI